MKHKLLLLLVVLFITGCSLDELRHDDRSEGGRAFSVEEAKEFFEKDFVGLLTRSQAEVTTEKKFVGKLHPGDFTPLWDNAVYSESDGIYTPRFSTPFLYSCTRTSTPLSVVAYTAIPLNPPLSLPLLMNVSGILLSSHPTSGISDSTYDAMVPVFTLRLTTSFW